MEGRKGTKKKKERRKEETFSNDISDVTQESKLNIVEKYK